MKETMCEERIEEATEALMGLTKGLRGYYPRRETEEAAGKYLQGLLSHVERKNSWQLAEEMGLETPYQFQHLLDRAKWDEEAVCDFHVERVSASLGKRGGTLILDETGFLKKGKMSAGVARQYSGTAGRIENCQIGVFLAWSTPSGHTLIDRELYIPKEWFKDKERCQRAGIPSQRQFMTKIVLGQIMIQRALSKGFRPDWVVADEVYGRDYKFRQFLEDHKQPYVVAVSKDQSVCQGWQKVPAYTLLSTLSPNQWQTINCGNGSKGPRTYAWARLPLNTPSPDMRRWLLLRQNLKDPTDIAYYLVSEPKEISLNDIVQAAGKRWAIEESFESAKGEVGLDHYEVRSYKGWYRHITLVLLAHALLVICKARIFPSSPHSAPMVVFKKKRGL
jgi:SRSO17 transposase